ncbi:hypothetical protein [Nitrosomonas sp.]|uniref:hypothetical protein n=1 Tax=Nitrosomonas sp. TaxID=42353 RepID=UPI0025D670CE|nr:hypothetical protein [Nitrosomonas sp.]
MKLYNLILVAGSSTGTGKTHLAAALALPLFITAGATFLHRRALGQPAGAGKTIE